MIQNRALLTLEEAAEQPIERVGGKARVLGQLCKAGFPVPEGFVIPDDADIKEVLPILSLAMTRFPGACWAVRSSSASEDTAQASYAGQYQSFLNIEPEEIPAYILKCRAAVNSDTVNAYRSLSTDSATSKNQLAVIVQLMVQADTAGIVFTADPLTGSRDWIWIEMVTGCGSAAADGSTNPVLVRLGRNDLEQHQPEQRSLLSDEDLGVLGRLALAVEKTMGEPQDIEWAFAAGHFLLLQARPLTTGEYGWTRANVAEIFPEPVTPITWSLLQRFLSGGSGKTVPLSRLIGGKVYLRHDLARRSFEWLLVIDGPTLERALGMEKWGRISPQRYTNWKNWAATLLFLADYFGIIHRLEYQVNYFVSSPRPAVPRENSTLDEILTGIGDWERWTKNAFGLHLYATTYAIAASRIARIGDKDDEPATRSSRIGKMLLDLSLQARRLGLEPELAQDQEGTYWQLRKRLESDPGGPDWIAQFDHFLAEYGCRCANEFELISPRWYETPEIPFGMIRAFLSGNKQVDSEHLSTGKEQNRSERKDGFGRMNAMREEMKHAVVIGYSALRGYYLRAGEQLSKSGKLDNTDDIFFLTDEELQQATRGQEDFRDGIKLRRARWESWRRQETLLAGQKYIRESKRLIGIPVSRGVISGAARVLSDLSGKPCFLPGEVLVLPNADPAWTPLFIQAAAVVCDVGGLMSHSATVAREFGVPAVFNTGNATHFIRDGQVVTVNGNEGWVQL